MVAVCRQTQRLERALATSAKSARSQATVHGVIGTIGCVIIPPDCLEMLSITAGGAAAGAGQDAFKDERPVGQSRRTSHVLFFVLQTFWHRLLPKKQRLSELEKLNTNT